MKLSLALLIWFIITFAGPFWLLVSGKVDLRANWRTADRSSAQFAPNPKNYKDAVIQVYTARAFSWRGLFGSHNWIAIKPKNATQYKVYQVIGWRKFWNLPPLLQQNDIPDRKWFGHPPRIIVDIRGKAAESLIDKIETAAKEYPYAQNYVLWPGPNSNTFPAFIGRKVPELGLALPSDSMGKDFLSGLQFFDRAPSGTGYQLSLFGILGILIAKKEGIEINLLGFVYGITFKPFAVLLPCIGPVPAGGNATSSV